MLLEFGVNVNCVVLRMFVMFTNTLAISMLSIAVILNITISLVLNLLFSCGMIKVTSGLILSPIVKFVVSVLFMLLFLSVTIKVTLYNPDILNGTV